MDNNSKTISMAHITRKLKSWKHKLGVQCNHIHHWLTVDERKILVTPIGGHVLCCMSHRFAAYLLVVFVGFSSLFGFIFNAFFPMSSAMHGPSMLGIVETKVMHITVDLLGFYFVPRGLHGVREHQSSGLRVFFYYALARICVFVPICAVQLIMGNICDARAHAHTWVSPREPAHPMRCSIMENVELIFLGVTFLIYAILLRAYFHFWESLEAVQRKPSAMMSEDSSLMGPPPPPGYTGEHPLLADEQKGSYQQQHHREQRYGQQPLKIRPPVSGSSGPGYGIIRGLGSQGKYASAVEFQLDSRAFLPDEGESEREQNHRDSRPVYNLQEHVINKLGPLSPQWGQEEYTQKHVDPGVPSASAEASRFLATARTSPRLPLVGDGDAYYQTKKKEAQHQEHHNSDLEEGKEAGHQEQSPPTFRASHMFEIRSPTQPPSFLTFYADRDNVDGLESPLHRIPSNAREREEKITKSQNLNQNRTIGWRSPRDERISGFESPEMPPKLPLNISDKDKEYYDNLYIEQRKKSREQREKAADAMMMEGRDQQVGPKIRVHPPRTEDHHVLPPSSHINEEQSSSIQRRSANEISSIPLNDEEREISSHSPTSKAGQTMGSGESCVTTDGVEHEVGSPSFTSVMMREAKALLPSNSSAALSSDSPYYSESNLH